MPRYHEIAPPPALAAAVECLWTLTPEPGDALHRVCPDGCTDLLLTGSMLQTVGAMTAWRDFPVQEAMMGVRFRPGGWPGAWGRPGTDAMEPLHHPRLVDRMLNAPTASARLRLLAEFVPPDHSSSAGRRAIAAIERAHGLVSIDETASQAGMSARQFRRVCLELTGLTPKLLAQVLRFRHAQARVASGAAAMVALDCGYYDQAHFINEFRRFSGRTPMADFSNRARAIASSLDA